MGEYKSASQRKKEMDEDTSLRRKTQQERDDISRRNSQKIRFLLEDVSLVSPFLEMFMLPFKQNMSLLAGKAPPESHDKFNPQKVFTEAIEDITESRSEGIIIYRDKHKNVCTRYFGGDIEHNGTIYDEAIIFGDLWEMLVTALHSLYGFTIATTDQMVEAIQRKEDLRGRIIAGADNKIDKMVDLKRYWDECLNFTKTLMQCDCEECVKTREKVKESYN